MILLKIKALNDILIIVILIDLIRLMIIEMKINYKKASEFKRAWNNVFTVGQTKS